ncbi:hypothetical protein phiA047_0059 [Aeromonas phage phiA047]|nr:hypothetical protein phiA047_0059 [Aeromonas phage phiA047]
MNKLNNFELHEEAMNLSALNTGYKLAKMYLQQKQELEQLKEKYANLNTLFEDYLKCHRVMVEEIERLQMQKSIDHTKIQYELEC